MNLTRPDMKKIKGPIPKLANIENSESKKETHSPQVKSDPKEGTKTPVIEPHVESPVKMEVVEVVDNKVKTEPFSSAVKMEEPVKQETPKQEYFSDNSVSLPGMGQAGPVGFEPGMFKKEGEPTASTSGIKHKDKDKADPSGIKVGF